jgi:putative transposase
MNRYSPIAVFSLPEGEPGRNPRPEQSRLLFWSSATFFRWRMKCGGMAVSLMTRMSEREADDRRLKGREVDAQQGMDLQWVPLAHT